ncbi:RNA-directed DNA polymerase, eukaryota, reverse transcriptase zinc-binding domain protein [Tanacetum coccineum]
MPSNSSADSEQRRRQQWWSGGKQRLRTAIGDGKSISVWHDKWCGIGPLDKIIQNRDIYDVRMNNGDCLADAICEGKWKWIDEWQNRYPEICNLEVPILSNSKDSALWISEGNKPMKYSTNAACLTLREKWPKVSWHHVVWFSQCNPKQDIILWMSIQRKLLTQDRMVWIQDGNLKCSLCNGCSDNHEHLFFECPFSKKVWDKIQVKGNNLCSNKLKDIVLQLSARPPKNKIWQVVDKLILSSTVYHIWMERNKRNFQHLKRTEEEMYGVILENITEMLKCLRVKKSTAVINMASQWGLKWDKESLISMVAA